MLSMASARFDFGEADGRFSSRRIRNAPEKIILNLDATDCGRHLLVAKLRKANIDASGWRD
jgi:hypothetical protein